MEIDVSVWPSLKYKEKCKEDSATSWSSGTLSDGGAQVMNSDLFQQGRNSSLWKVFAEVVGNAEGFEVREL